MNRNPLIRRDFYKFGHREQYEPGCSMIYTNLTARGSRLPVNYAVVAGFTRYFHELNDIWGAFFDSKKTRDKYIGEYSYLAAKSLGQKFPDIKHLLDLWDLGFLPIAVNTLEEGTRCPVRVPMASMYNTVPEFFWLPQALETDFSSEIWKSITAATIATIFRTMFNEYLEKTGSDKGLASFMGHGFEYRGMSGYADATMSGMAHLMSFQGTDTAPAILELNDLYGRPADNSAWGYSVPATEHSVMSYSGQENEREAMKRLITEVYPNGIVSLVSDTWNLWKVLNEYLPSMRNEIMARDGKVVIRPDSGNPELIICGDPSSSDPQVKEGVIKSLIRNFGSETTPKEFIKPNSKVGAIYGDSITIDRAKAICENLIGQGICPSSMVFGIGSFTYEYVTRDSLCLAMKATAGYNQFHKLRNICKNPITDDGMKKSALGICGVFYDEATGELVLKDQRDSVNDQGLLINRYYNGYIKHPISFERVRVNTGVWQ